MAQIVNSRCVLAVRDLEVSTKYYVDVLGFRKDPIDAAAPSAARRSSLLHVRSVSASAKPKILLQSSLKSSAISVAFRWAVHRYPCFPLFDDSPIRRPSTHR